MKRSWGFPIGFAAGLLMFVAANVVTYYQMLRGTLLTDVSRSFGFPFRLYAITGFGGEWIIWTGLIADILIALCGSVFVGLIATKVFRRLAPR